eukprot:g1683.t1
MPTIYGSNSQSLLGLMAKEGGLGNQVEDYKVYHTCPGAMYFHRPNPEDRPIIVQVAEKLGAEAEAAAKEVSAARCFLQEHVPPIWQGAVSVGSGLVVGWGGLKCAEWVLQWCKGCLDGRRKRWSGDRS